MMQPSRVVDTDAIVVSVAASARIHSRGRAATVSARFEAGDTTTGVEFSHPEIQPGPIEPYCRKRPWNAAMGVMRAVEGSTAARRVRSPSNAEHTSDALPGLPVVQWTLKRECAASNWLARLRCQSRDSSRAWSAAYHRPRSDPDIGSEPNALSTYSAPSPSALTASIQPYSLPLGTVQLVSAASASPTRPTARTIRCLRTSPRTCHSRLPDRRSLADEVMSGTCCCHRVADGCAISISRRSTPSSRMLKTSARPFSSSARLSARISSNGPPGGPT